MFVTIIINLTSLIVNWYINFSYNNNQSFCFNCIDDFVFVNRIVLFFVFQRRQQKRFFLFNKKHYFYINVYLSTNHLTFVDHFIFVVVFSFHWINESFSILNDTRYSIESKKNDFILFVVIRLTQQFDSFFLSMTIFFE